MTKRQSPYDIPRLCLAMKQARLSLRRAREERRDMVRLYAGRHYSEEGSDKAQPVNLIALYLSIVGRKLVPNNPRGMWSTFDMASKPAVNAMEKWANKEIERMHLDSSILRVVHDALFSFGIMKVGLADPAEAALVGWRLKAGQPFCEPVDLDDLVWDQHAKRFEELGYIGHRIRVPLRAVKESKYFSKARKDLEASPNPMFNQEGDERIGMIGREYYSNEEEYEDFVDLWEIYFPRDRMIITLADQQMEGPSNGEPLHVQPWIGHELGPYHMLGYGPVPGNLRPKGPIQDLADLHEACNRTYRKLMRTIDRLKEVTMADGSADGDIERVIQANDGDAIRVNNPERIKQIVLSGNTLQQLMLIGPHFREVFDMMAGGLQTLGGLAPSSPTAHQDAMLNENASATLQEMQKSTINFTAGVMRCLGWYWWHDPFSVQKTVIQPRGVPEVQVGVELHPASEPDPRKLKRTGKFEDLDIEVDPYSMQHSTPAQRLKDLREIVTTIVVPMASLLQQQGVVFDINAFLKKLAKYMDAPDLQEMVTMQAPPAPVGDPSQGGGGEAPGGMPAQTERTYNRVSMPGRTQSGNDMMLKNALLGVNGGGNAASANGAMKGPAGVP